MNKYSQDILNRISSKAKEVLPSGATIKLYGSRARGDNRPDSDWDILILLDKQRIEREDRDKISYPFRELGWDIDAIINPVMYTKKDWETSRSLFHNFVEEDAITL